MLWKRFSRLVRDARQVLAVAWDMDARLTAVYYATALIAALLPLATGLTLKAVIDGVVVTAPEQATIPIAIVIAVAAHFAIIAINAAVRYGLHEQYYDFLFRYRLQDTFSYRFCEKLSQLDVPHLEDASVQQLITKVRDTHSWRVPDFFRVLGYAQIAVIGVISAAVALAPYGAWIVPIVIAGAVPRLYPARAVRRDPVVDVRLGRARGA